MGWLGVVYIKINNNCALLRVYLNLRVRKCSNRIGLLSLNLALTKLEIKHEYKEGENICHSIYEVFASSLSPFVHQVTVLPFADLVL